MTGFKSYTKEEIRNAMLTGSTIWALDTADSGYDDHIIADTYDQALSDVLTYHEISTLPEGWTLEEVFWEI